MRKCRKEKGLTIVQLSQKSGIHRNTISGFEKDLHTPNLFNLIDLADTLNVSIDEYIGRGVKQQKERR